MTTDTAALENRSKRYKAVWRWHFYAGLMVIPVLMLLTISGLGMLIAKPIDDALNQHLLVIEAQEKRLADSVLLGNVKEHYQHDMVTLYIPAQVENASAVFSLKPAHAQGHGGHNPESLLVYVNPYTGKILGDRASSDSWYNTVKTLHGSIYLGDTGDLIIEITAGFAVLLIVTGLYLAWPGQGWQTLLPPRRLKSRADWRQLHRTIGWFIAIPLFFFLMSGLAWTNIWGGKFVQPWNSVIGTNYNASEVTHSSLNDQGAHRVPWALEQTALPQSHGDLNKLTLDDVTKFAQEHGFKGFRVHLPQGHHSVWTISATTMAGDITNPLGDNIVHLEPSNGQVLANISFSDYSAIGKAMAAFIPFHEGNLGLWNWLLNIVLVVIIFMLMVSGLVMWFKRQRQKSFSVNAPKAAKQQGRNVILIMCLLSLCFPMTAAALLCIILIDWLITARLVFWNSVIK
ncbi:PepSY domain-containing protein [Thalassotalea sp. 1_MG-2023]|uniref:PepSY-associated TM helix domain-containing protein n=1 Tax=Thalassotalea sp. 1_MG-2023 TaxID=3062680 RepID=UPI0026E1A144|nr:PepSY domain-containing protein [Thalassotalea sp. 1_MG-2023]MDO6426555.1 PepSY domain-containing protein [Thalassotalea sp. 1_MG-2023]